MAAFHPAAEPPAIERGPTITVNMKSLGNSLLPTCNRHNDFERRAGCELRLDGFIHQRLARVVHQLAPLIARDTHGEIVGIECGAACHGQDFACPWIHGHDGPVLVPQRFFRRNLQINVHGQLERLSGFKRYFCLRFSYFFPATVDHDPARPIFSHQ